MRNIKRSTVMVFVLLIVLISIFSTAWGVKNANDTRDLDDAYMLGSIYPCNVGNYSYFFELDTHGVLIVTYGSRGTDEMLSKDFFREVETERSILLSEEQIAKFIFLAGRIENHEEIRKEMVTNDSVDFQIWYNNSTYEINYYDKNPEYEIFREIINTFIECSPIEVNPSSRA